MSENYQEIREKAQKRIQLWDDEKKALKELISNREYLRKLVDEATLGKDDAPFEILRIFNGCHVFGFPLPSQIRAYIATAFQYIAKGYSPYDTLHLKAPNKRGPSYRVVWEQWEIHHAVRRVMFEEGLSQTAAAEAVAADIGMSESKVKEAYTDFKKSGKGKHGVPEHLIFSTIKK